MIKGFDEMTDEELCELVRQWDASEGICLSYKMLQTRLGENYHKWKERDDMLRELREL